MRLDGVDGDPVIRLYCPVDDAEAVGFDEVFRPQHLDLSFGQVRAVPRVLVGAAGLATVASFGWDTASSIGGIRRRRRPPAPGRLSSS